MKAPIDGFWAKLTRDANHALVSWHPLLSHCADVAACMHVLLSYTILSRRLAATIGASELTRTTLARLSFLAALHDAGKVNLGFQRRAYPPSLEAGKRAGHLSPLIDVLNSSDPIKLEILGALCVGELCEWFDDDDDADKIIDMLVTTWGHHGRPVPIGVGFDASLWRDATLRGAPRSPVSGLEALSAHARAWLPHAFDEIEGDFLPATPAFQHLYNGILTLADWMGSDSRFFTFETEDPRDRFDWACEVALDLCRANGMVCEPARSSRWRASRLRAYRQPVRAQADAARVRLPRYSPRRRGRRPGV